MEASSPLLCLTGYSHLAAALQAGAAGAHRQRRAARPHRAAAAVGGCHGGLLHAAAGAEPRAGDASLCSVRVAWGRWATCGAARAQGLLAGLGARPTSSLLHSALLPCPCRHRRPVVLLLRLLFCCHPLAMGANMVPVLPDKRAPWHALGRLFLVARGCVLAGCAICCCMIPGGAQSRLKRHSEIPPTFHTHPCTAGSRCSSRRSASCCRRSHSWPCKPRVQSTQ